MIKIFSAIIFIIFLNACSYKIDIKTLKASKIDDLDIKTLSILEFKNDNISLKNTIKNSLLNIKFNNKPYFTIINRDIVNDILKEQKLQDLGIVDGSKDIEALKDVRAILSGSVDIKYDEKQYYYKEFPDYDRCLKYKYVNGKKKYCMKYYKSKKLCLNHKYYLDISIDISKVTDASSIYTRNFYEKKEIDECPYTNSIYSSYDIYKSLANIIIKKFIYDIAPHYEYFEVEIIDDNDIDYTNKEENLFDKALYEIKNKNISAANLLFEKLVYLTKSKSYTALYNYGLTFEALNKLEKALSYYKKSNFIALNKNIIIQNAIKRVTKALINKNNVEKQLLN